MKYGFSLKGELNTTENNIRQNLSNLVGEERRVCAAETLGGLQVMRGQREGPGTRDGCIKGVWTVP